MKLLRFCYKKFTLLSPFGREVALNPLVVVCMKKFSNRINVLWNVVNLVFFVISIFRDSIAVVEKRCKVTSLYLFSQIMAKI